MALQLIYAESINIPYDVADVEIRLEAGHRYASSYDAWFSAGVYINDTILANRGGSQILESLSFSGIYSGLGPGSYIFNARWDGGPNIRLYQPLLFFTVTNRK